MRALLPSHPSSTRSSSSSSGVRILSPPSSFSISSYSTISPPLPSPPSSWDGSVRNK